MHWPLAKFFLICCDYVSFTVVLTSSYVCIKMSILFPRMVASHHWLISQARKPNVWTCASSRTEQHYYCNDLSSDRHKLLLNFCTHTLLLLWPQTTVQSDVNKNTNKAWGNLTATALEQHLTSNHSDSSSLIWCSQWQWHRAASNSRLKHSHRLRKQTAATDSYTAGGIRVHVKPRFGAGWVMSECTVCLGSESWDCGALWRTAKFPPFTFSDIDMC